MNPLARLLEEKRIILCMGPGGVGKTTLAAALALEAAARGRKTCVCTIDPAKRLATSLGLAQFGNVETQIPAERFSRHGLPIPRAPLYAMMLDAGMAWDELIEREAAPERAQAILKSRFYGQLSSSIAGAHEYVAMEKLHQLRTERDYELIVLDSPPAANALDFIDAPNRVLDFFGSSVTRRLLAPALGAGRLGLKALDLAGGLFTRTLSKITGMELLEELARFLSDLAPLYGFFESRAASVRAMLRAPDTSALLVSSPGAHTVDEAIGFCGDLRARGLEIGAVVANRVAPGVALQGERQVARELARLDEALREKLERVRAEASQRAEEDARQVERLRRAAAPAPLLSLSRFESDVYDLPELRRLASCLMAQTFPDGGARAEVVARRRKR